MSTLDTILVIDDDSLFCEFLKLLLEDFGYRMIQAAQGADGVELCLQEEPDLILLDINLPDLDGPQVCRRLKAEPKLKDIPVIFLSGLLDPTEKLKAFSAGGVDYITKPFEGQELHVRIQSHLEIRKQRRDLEASQELLKKALFDAGMMNGKLVAMNEKLRQSEQIKSQFIANMRNEINNPLSAILGLAEEITHPSLPMEQGRQLAQRIHAEASMLDFQLRNVFAAAELEAGEAAPAITWVDLGSVLCDAVDSLKHFADSKSVKITLPFLQSGDSIVFPTDGEKLRVIAVNLIDNAIEYSHTGGLVEVHAEIRDDTLILAVKDEGIGLSDENRSHIFERFHQLDSGTMRQHHGQGLGLSVVKALVEFLDGWIKVESALGQGSCFTVGLSKGTVGEAFGDSFGGDLLIFGDGEES